MAKKLYEKTIPGINYSHETLQMNYLNETIHMKLFTRNYSHETIHIKLFK